MFLNGYPYTDFHEMNLDFLLKSMEALKQAFESFTASNSLIFAEPLLHNITSTYAKNTIVLDPDGNAYISLQNVPSGVQLSNADYWLMVFNFEDYTEKANKNFTNNYFRDTTRAPYALSVGAWIVLDDVLYTVTQAIAADELFVIGTNLTHFTVEQFLKDFTTSIVQTVNQYKNDIDASELQYRNQLAQDIADTTATLTAQLNTALSGITVDSEVIDARLGADGVTYSTLGIELRTLISLLNPTINALTGTLTQGYVNTTGGRNTGNPGWRYTDYLPIWGAKLIYKIVDGQVLGANGWNIAFFDENKLFLSGYNASTAGTVLEVFDVPDTAKYVVISNLTAADWANSYIEFADLEGQILHSAKLATNELLTDYGYIEETPLTMTLNQGYVKADGTFGSDSNWRYTPPIPVRGEKIFVFFDSPTALNTSVGWNIAFFDASDTFISGEEFNHQVVNAAYVNVPLTAASVRISTTASSNWSTAYIICASANNIFKVVAKDGSGDYSSVAAAVADAVTGDIIIIKPGNYTNEHIEAWGKTLTIIGTSPDEVIISCNDSTYNNPCLEFSTGVLKNVTIQKLNGGSGTGYPMHDEDDYSYNKPMWIENCVFITPDAATVGMGMRGGSNITFKNCKFLAPNQQGAVVYMHDADNSAYVGTNNVLFDSCYFFNLGNYIMMIQSQEKTGAVINLKFNDCRFYGNGAALKPYINSTNYYGGTGSASDFLGCINYRLDPSSTGNNLTVLNVLPEYNGTTP